MDWTIDFSVVIRSVYWLAAGVALLAVLTLVRVSVMRSLERAREYSTQRLREQWIPVLNGSSATGAAFPPLPPGFVLEFMTLWNAAQEATYRAPGDRAHARVLLNGIARRCNMAARAGTLLRSRDLSERILAITMLGHLRDIAAAPELRRLLESSHPLVSFAAARALLQISPAFAGRFVETMLQRADWAPSRLLTVVGEERADLAPPMLRLARERNPKIVRRLVPYLRLLDRDESVEVVRGVLSGMVDAQALASALKVIAAIGDPSDAALACRLAGHADWRVRVQVANALAQLGSVADAAVLEKLLGDRHWWVRYRAAQSLALLLKTPDLQAVLSRQQDPFARDMLRQIVAEFTLALQGRVA